MLPTLFRIGPYSVASHDFFVMLGALCALGVYGWEARRRRMLEEPIVWIALGSLLCGAIAAKLSTLWIYLSVAPEPSLEGVIVSGGKSILGGLAGAYVGALATKRLVGYREPTGDLFAPAVALGMAVGRWGCFLSEQPGTATSLPWGITVDREAGARIPNCPPCAAGLPMHPSFLYEIAFHAAMFAWLLRLRHRVPVRGELLKIYLLCYALFRFAVEFVRGNEPVWAGLSRSQLFLIPSTLLLLAYFWRQRARGVYVVPSLERAP
jgi:phosphatidylglycerol:prolipoprotein diacylglycerol transferase